MTELKSPQYEPDDGELFDHILAEIRRQANQHRHGELISSLFDDDVEGDISSAQPVQPSKAPGQT